MSAKLEQVGWYLRTPDGTYFLNSPVSSIESSTKAVPMYIYVEEDDERNSESD
jgi:hypothetical protein